MVDGSVIKDRIESINTAIEEMYVEFFGEVLKAGMKCKDFSAFHAREFTKRICEDSNLRAITIGREEEDEQYAMVG